MKKFFKICSAFILLSPSIVFAESANEMLENWVDINSNQIGKFSLRAVGKNNSYKDSLFKSKNGEYHWFMRVDYTEPKGVIAYRIMNGYFNCDKSEVLFDQQLEYTKDGVVVNAIGSKGGKRQIIPISPNSISEQSLNFVCKVKFD